MTPTTHDVDHGEEQARAQDARRERRHTVIIVIFGVLLAIALALLWK